EARAQAALENGREDEGGEHALHGPAVPRHQAGEAEETRPAREIATQDQRLAGMAVGYGTAERAQQEGGKGGEHHQQTDEAGGAGSLPGPEHHHHGERLVAELAHGLTLPEHEEALVEEFLRLDGLR